MAATQFQDAKARCTPRAVKLSVPARGNHVVTAMYRPSTEKSAYELTWSLPLWQQLRLYFIYFDGYGESLLDYDHRTKRIGIGIGLNDYLDAPASAL